MDEERSAQKYRNTSCLIRKKGRNFFLFVIGVSINVLFDLDLSFKIKAEIMTERLL